MRNILWIAILAFAPALGLSAPLVVLDSGHEPRDGGATSSCLKREVIYNDEIVRALQRSLSSYKIILTRQFGENMEAEHPELLLFLGARVRSLWPQRKALLARAAMANERHADLFISVHHDSVPEKQLIIDPKLCAGSGGKRIRDEFKKRYKIGYNIFLNGEAAEPQRGKSLRLAQMIGKRLRALGRIPSDYHVYPDDDCKSCRPIDAPLGIWHEDLVVLRNANMPAILIELGNLVDPEDERAVSKPEFRQAFAKAVQGALDEYFIEGG